MTTTRRAAIVAPMRCVGGGQGVAAVFEAA